ncbi:hypothetical protein D3C87_1346140 [compost metagenome]
MDPGHQRQHLSTDRLRGLQAGVPAPVRIRDRWSGLRRRCGSGRGDSRPRLIAGRSRVDHILWPARRACPAAHSPSQIIQRHQTMRHGHAARSAGQGPQCLRTDLDDTFIRHRLPAGGRQATDPMRALPGRGHAAGLTSGGFHNRAGKPDDAARGADRHRGQQGG